MELFTFAALVVVVSALASVFNARVLRLPETIGLMATGLLASGAFLAFGSVFPSAVKRVENWVEAFDFSAFVLDYALAFLVFAGAFSSDEKTMVKERVPILIFATLGILISTFIVGALTYGITKLVGLAEVPFIHCLLFGALISPTDPIAVLAILKGSAVPRSLQADIEGESLLNDGVAVVVFLTILQLAGGDAAIEGGNGHAEPGGVGGTLLLFSREVFGGVLLGAAFGWLGTRLVMLVHIAAIDILLSLAAVMGVYAVASHLHVSGPLAAVVTGLVFGKAFHSRETDASEQAMLDSFWEGIDHVLNAVLFTMMGMVLLGLADLFRWDHLFAGMLAIPAVLIARLVSVSLPMPFTSLSRGKPGQKILLLTWGGLRGGISIAMALSLSEGMSRDLILQMTYVVVAFSILVQGLSISSLVKRLMPESADAEA